MAIELGDPFRSPNDAALPYSDYFADPNQIVLNSVPVQPGDRVEVTVLAQSRQRTEIVKRVKKLLQETHSLPQFVKISEEEIAAEIVASRNGQ